jgi:hypothetical protein
MGFPPDPIGSVLPLAVAFAMYDLKILIMMSMLVFEASSALCWGPFDDEHAHC